MNEAVERVIELDASLAEVWSSLTEPARLSAWLGGDVELDVRPGGRGTVHRADGAVRRVVVEAVEPRRRLAIRWWPFEEPGGIGPPGPGTRVEFVVDRADGGTRLTVTELPPEVGPRPAVEPPAIGFTLPPAGPSSEMQAAAR
jgi:uncharacterized protein YndB with AHSA1/START domain